MPNPTKVQARYLATSLDVCKDSDKVAIHCSTAHGTVIVVASLREFTQKLRGAKDWHGHPLPSVADFRREPASPPAESAPPRPPAVGISPAFETAWSFFKENAHLTIGDCALKHQISAATFGYWISIAHPGELRAIRAEKGLALRARTQREHQDSDGPLLKPSGRIL